mmetsp:Transcript_39857/g.124590  ORF Transcript_39857/g.124590 Transcript_39857/m.124590 type:complete len:299 (-) Transcript_39857:286-1182(-)
MKRGRALSTTCAVLLAGSAGLAAASPGGNATLHRDLSQYTDVMLTHVGAGQGTTASHAVFEALCSASVPAVHWRRTCNDVPREGLEAHDRAVFLHTAAVLCVKTGHHGLHPRCAEGTDESGAKLERHIWSTVTCWEGENCCPAYDATVALIEHVQCDARKWVQALRQVAREVVTSGIGGVSDLPYPAMLPTLSRAAQDAPLRVILSTRQAGKWYKRRVGTTGLAHGDRNIVCRLPDGIDSRLGDWEGCVNNAVKNSPPDEHIHLDSVFQMLSEAEVCKSKSLARRRGAKAGSPYRDLP